MLPSFARIGKTRIHRPGHLRYTHSLAGWIGSSALSLLEFYWVHSRVSCRSSSLSTLPAVRGRKEGVQYTTPPLPTLVRTLVQPTPPAPAPLVHAPSHPIPSESSLRACMTSSSPQPARPRPLVHGYLSLRFLSPPPSLISPPRPAHSRPAQPHQPPRSMPSLSRRFHPRAQPLPQCPLTLSLGVSFAPEVIRPSLRVPVDDSTRRWTEGTKRGGDMGFA